MARVNTRDSKDEIAHLAQTFNRMLDRLEEAFVIQKAFVSNASHEMRTPLTAISAQIEVTLMKAREREEYEKILYSLLDDIRQMSALTNGLLALAQSGLSDKALEMKKLRVDEILWSVRSDFLRRKPDLHRRDGLWRNAGRRRATVRDRQ